MSLMARTLKPIDLNAIYLRRSRNAENNHPNLIRRIVNYKHYTTLVEVSCKRSLNHPMNTKHTQTCIILAGQLSLLN